MGQFSMTVKWPNPALFYLGHYDFLGLLKGSEQFLTHHLDRASQASQLMGLKKYIPTEYCTSKGDLILTMMGEQGRTILYDTT